VFFDHAKWAIVLLKRNPQQWSRNAGMCKTQSERREVWTICGRRFDLSWPADMDALLDSPETQRRFQRDEYMPYWAQPWPASVLLAEAVLSGPHGHGQAAIELGCGIGLVSIAAAMKGWSITASDYDARAIEFAVLNGQRSGVRFAGSRLLDYRDPPLDPRYALILCSDLLYERRNILPVARWIDGGLISNGVALVSDPNRSAADGFPEALASLDLRSEVRAVETMSPSGLLIQGRIWRITRGEQA
jgi:predicted nicotinamide N-methyase